MLNGTITGRLPGEVPPLLPGPASNPTCAPPLPPEEAAALPEPGLDPRYRGQGGA